MKHMSNLIFNETERTIASGGTNFEHGLSWGDGVVEVNDANVFASMPATDQRQVNEMVRSMAAELPAGVDLSKAKAWVVCLFTKVWKLLRPWDGSV